MTPLFGSLIGSIFGLWWLWIPIVSIFGYLTYRNTKQAKAMSQHSGETVVLVLEIPRTNDKKELAAEQMFAALHGILRPKNEIRRTGMLQEHISFEIASIGQQIRFYVWIPKYLQNFVEGQIYAQYPTVQIYPLKEDYATRELQYPVIHTAELTTTDNEVLPIKTFTSFEVDPLAGITATLAKLDKQEEMWIQVLCRPIDDSWHQRGAKVVQRIKSGGGGFISKGGFLSWIGQVFGALFKPPEASKSGGSADVSDRDRARITAITEKSTKLGYQVKVRLAYLGTDQYTAKLRMQAIVGTFKQFNTTNLNGFAVSHASFAREKVIEYRSRHFIEQGTILNIEELASLYHLPHTTVETPNIVWATSKTAEPPSTLPSASNSKDGEVSYFGVTNFRGMNTQFGIRRSDRGRHIYILGQTGVGKSGLLELLTLSDIFHNEGFGVIDPHGDYAQHMLQYIPAHRINDVVYFNPADVDFPIGFNPLEVTDPALKTHISSELVGVLKRMFESWGPRLEYILRYTILALLDYPNSTMLDITRMLTENDFRRRVVEMVQDPVVKNFWTTEFASWNEKFATEAVAPVLNKVGAFTANPMIRNIIGQPQGTFNIRRIMDDGKILIVNLSRGLVGEDNAAILGAMIVTKIQLAAMSRANVDLDKRRAFYLYVDEFQNFATDSFAVILSEARKYGLNLTVANQYTTQMNPIVKDAVFGNVGSMVVFRVGADDGNLLQKYFDPQFTAQDIMNLHNRSFIASLQINGEKTIPFSGNSLVIPPHQEDHTQAIIEQSRARYTRSRAEVEHMIREATTPAPRPPQQANNQRSQHQQPNNPQPASNQSEIRVSHGPSVQNTNNEGSPKKRTRSRRKSSHSAAPTQTPESSKPTEQSNRTINEHGEVEIRLR